MKERASEIEESTRRMTTPPDSQMAPAMEQLPPSRPRSGRSRAVAEGLRSGRQLADALAAVEVKYDLDGWRDLIRPLDAEDIPPSFSTRSWTTPTRASGWRY